MMKFPIYGKIIQMFQTTTQYLLRIFPRFPIQRPSNLAAMAMAERRRACSSSSPTRWSGTLRWKSPPLRPDFWGTPDFWGEEHQDLGGQFLTWGSSFFGNQLWNMGWNTSFLKGIDVISAWKELAIRKSTALRCGDIPLMGNHVNFQIQMERFPSSTFPSFNFTWKMSINQCIFDAQSAYNHCGPIGQQWLSISFNISQWI